jgi:hypothetical protein
MSETNNSRDRSRQSRRPDRHPRRSGLPFGVEVLEQRLLLAVNWDGGGDGTSWTDPLNWSGDQLPSAMDDVRITTGPAGLFTVALDSDVTVNSLTIGSGTCTTQPELKLERATITAAGGVSVTGCGRLELADAEIVGPVSNRATLRVFGTSAIHGPLTQENYLTIRGDEEFGHATLVVDNGFTNRSQLELTSDGAFNATLTITSGTLRNESSINVTHIGSEPAGQRAINAPVVNNGSIYVNSDLALFATLENNSYLRVERELSVTSDLMNTSGVQIGRTGVVNVGGNYTQGTSDSLSIVVDGNAAGDGFGQLNVTGSAALDGYLYLNDSGTASPANGQTISPITFGSHTGNFREIYDLNFRRGLTYTTSLTDTAFQLHAPVLADLVVDSTIVPASMTMHDSVEISWTVRNQGPDSDELSWTDELFLSADLLLDAIDRSLGSMQFDDPPLESGGMYAATHDVTIPPFAAGNAFLLFKVDSYQNHFESDETNNVHAVPVQSWPPTSISR